MLVIGVTTDLRGKHISPRGPSGERYSFGGSKAGGSWKIWGGSGVNSGGERDGEAKISREVETEMVIRWRTMAKLKGP